MVASSSTPTSITSGLFSNKGGARPCVWLEKGEGVGEGVAVWVGVPASEKRELSGLGGVQREHMRGHCVAMDECVHGAGA